MGFRYALRLGVDMHLRTMVLIFTISLSFAFKFAEAAPIPTSAPIQKVKEKDPSAIFNVSDLSLEMAEATYKLSKNQKSLGDLVSALETYLNQSCMRDLPTTLIYKGSPTDPICFQRMQHLLSIHANNPVGICVRDGINADSCITAFNSQVVKIYDYSQDTDTDLVDPLLKAGLPSTELEKITQLQGRLNEIKGMDPAILADEDKDKLKKEGYTIYNKLLSLACRISVTKLQLPAGAAALPTPDPRIEEVRYKLLQVPENMRRDYQDKMVQEYEEQLARAKDSPDEKALIVKILDTIENPEVTAVTTAAGLERVRYILPVCGRMIDLVSSEDKLLPEPTCYLQSWYTPQCVKAWERLNASKRQAAIATYGSKSNSSEVISTF